MIQLVSFKKKSTQLEHQIWSRAVVAGDASHGGSGYIEMMRILAAPVLQRLYRLGLLIKKTEIGKYCKCEK
jgi:hypothetical protein